jgi:hypothetical protein
LEGTAPLDQIHIPSKENAIKIRLKMCVKPGVANGFEMRDVLFHEYLNVLSQTVAALTQVINSPFGGRHFGTGIPSSGGFAMRGWISNGVFTPSLDSDPAVNMAFYHRVVYSGLRSGADVKGCLPVEPLESGGGTGFLAGCHPFSLSSMDLKGLSIPVKEDRFNLIAEVMNEAHPPLVDHFVLRRLSDLWAPCTKLSDVNADVATRRQQGVSYVRVACMETPAIPEFADGICIIKNLVCDLANQINSSRPDSDGAFFVSCREKTGTGCHIFVEVPAKEHSPTIVNSLRLALMRLDFPGYLPIGDEEQNSTPEKKKV